MADGLFAKIEKLLPLVEMPARYIGGEWNSVVKGPASVRVRLALAFPDAYEIGMSHLGLQMLYHIANSLDFASCERVFAPWIDMEARMRANGIPLFSHETHSAAADFDVLGFSLQHEMAYSNVLNMLELAGLPLAAAERSGRHPLVVAGGPAVFNPEPIAEAFDVVIVGDGEEALTKLLEAVRDGKAAGATREQVLENIARNVPGAYVPAFYSAEYDAAGHFKSLTPLKPFVPAVIKKARVKELVNDLYPVRPVVPFGEAVHERIVLEIMRGCPNMCRFCQSAGVKSPLRMRSVEDLVSLAEQTYAATGYDEISLMSLSTGDYPWLDELMLRLNARFKSRAVGLSLPSLRIDDKLKRLPEVIAAVRKTGFTLAPEAGTEFMRKIIGKPISDADLIATAESAFTAGWRVIKLYFMIGLPGERDEDLHAIAQLSRGVSECARKIIRSPGNINVTISPFVPKPHTPLQWEPMAPLGEIRRKMEVVRFRTGRGRIQLKMHECERSYLEAVFSRGDRRLWPALLEAHRGGCRFDEWDEHFEFGKWREAFAKCGIDTDAYACRRYAEGDALPWGHIEGGIPAERLVGEYRASLEARKA